MSYDISFEADLGGVQRAPVLPDYEMNLTWNYGPLWRHLALDIAAMDGVEIGSYNYIFREALANLDAMTDAEIAVHIRGDGQWGNPLHFHECLQRLQHVAMNFPKAIVRVS